MARGVNLVILVGNLGRDPESRTMPSGAVVSNFSIATTESWKDKQSGERQERTEWHRCSCFGRLAEIANQYLRKGSQVYVEGKLITRKWTDKQGVERYTTEVTVNNLQMLGGRRDEDSGPRREPRQQGRDYEDVDTTQKPAPSSDDFDDDIPF